MYGQITRFNENLGVGIIEAENTRKYRFKQGEIVNTGNSIVGNDVEFLLVGGRPAEIFVMAGSAWTAFGPVKKN